MNTSKNSDQYLEACSNFELEQEVFVRSNFVEASKKELHRLLEERARINRKILEQETLFRLRLDRLAKVREILSERGFSITHTDNLITED